MALYLKYIRRKRIIRLTKLSERSACRSLLHQEAQNILAAKRRPSTSKPIIGPITGR